MSAFDTLVEPDAFWDENEDWLKQEGYNLRREYYPGWVKTWKYGDIIRWEGTGRDATPVIRFPFVDAVQTSTGRVVMLKKVDGTKNFRELEISQFLSSEPRASDPHNHCVPILDVLELPGNEDAVILVMPLLHWYDDPRFRTIGEALEFFRQLFEGLQFMHNLLVAHRDCMTLNVMVDPHAVPKRYYLANFAISTRFEDKSFLLTYVTYGGDRSVPEFGMDPDCYNPFPTDIYYIGNLIQEDFLKHSSSFESVRGLIDDMVQQDSRKRPTIDEVIARFNKICQALPQSHLRSRVVWGHEDPRKRATRNLTHRLRLVWDFLSLPSI